MEGDHDKAPMRAQHALGCFESARKLSQFVVHIEPKRLERARGRVDRLGQRGRPQSLCDHFGEFSRARDRPRGDYGAGETARKFLLAQGCDDVRELRFVHRVDDVGGRRAFKAHAHVERAIETERKSALGFVELERGDAKIENHALCAAFARFAENPIHLRIAAKCEGQTAFVGQSHEAAARNGLRVPFDAKHPAVFRIENGARVTAAAERSLDAVGAITKRKPLDTFPQQNGNVPLAHTAPSVRKARARASFSARIAAKRSASQIWNLRPRPTKLTRSLSPAWAMRSSGKRTRPFSSAAKSCVLERTAKDLSS